MGALTGKTALVTGGSRGIGRGIAERLGRDGARVGVHYGSDETAAKETVAAIEAAGGSAFAIRARLGEPGDAAALWAEFDKHADGLDILVNNAGVGLQAEVADTTEEDYDRIFDINVKALFFITQQALPRLRDGGRIVNLSTGLTRIAMPGLAAYAATKGAVDTLTLSLAEGLGPRGITVNAVAPGVIETDMNAWLADPQAREMANGWSTFGRVGQPEDVADIVGFLAGAGGRWVTGQTIDATGGSSLGA
ncbi:SDR family oxidoreductase [Streptomyces sp. A7024]|uniref:SDR family oxidoreductase n=1 Tax=Streptomyces coryli TaxID=1128680 RepID=A0A6G4U9H8_9ACTN|nr:SDR family oxidoreductase [Streptomyces coryli]NGN68895.1 SDR family oxidoreductase [Streptomyces coryli]